MSGAVATIVLEETPEGHVAMKCTFSGDKDSAAHHAARTMIAHMDRQSAWKATQSPTVIEQPRAPRIILPNG